MLVGTPNHRGTTLQVLGIPTFNVADVVIEVDDIQRFNEFALQSSVGFMDVLASLDGVTFSTPIALYDRSATAAEIRVLEAGPGPSYSFEGNYKALRIRQSQLGFVTDAVLVCGKIGRSQD